MHAPSHRTGPPGKKIDVGTPAGASRIRVTLALSLVSAIATAGAFVILGRIVDDGPLIYAIVAVAALAVVAAASTGAGMWISQTGARKEEVPLRARLLRRWWSGVPDERDHVSAGGHVALMTESVERVSTYRQTFLGPTFGAALAPIAVLLVLGLAVDAVIAGLLAIAVPLIPLVIVGFSRAFRKVSGASRRARAALATRYLESIQGLEAIALLGAAPRVAADLAEAGERNRRATMRLLARNQVVLLVTDAVFSLGIVTAAVVLAAWRLGAGAITPGEAIAVLLCAILLLEPLNLIGSFFYIGMGGMASQRAIRRFLGARPAPADMAEPAATPGRDASAHVRVDGATLGYGGTEVVQEASMAVGRGDRAVIVGPSGGGKSTLLWALKGDLVPSSGEVVVDGIRLAAGTRRKVRAASALVSQTTWLFTGTIADNLLLAAPDATEDQLWAALDLVDLGGFVRRAPLGLDTPVGERGLALSGGQAQRISLARAFLSRRRLLLLDEPTSQVDLASERIILDALDRLADDHTIVLVTHRPSTTGNASSHWAMRDGRLEAIRA